MILNLLKYNVVRVLVTYDSMNMYLFQIYVIIFFQKTNK